MTHLRRRSRGGRTRYYVRLNDGNELAAGTDYQTARAVLAHYRNRAVLERHGIATPNPSTWTLSRLSKWDLARQKHPDRAQRWAFLLSQLGSSTRLEDLRPKVDAWLSRRLKAVSPATVNRNRAFLQAALKRAKTAAGLEIDPLGGLMSLKETRAKVTVWGPEDVSRFLSVCRRLAAKRAEWAQDADMIEVLYLTASRLSQVLELRWDQVRCELLYFPPQKKGLERWFRLEGRLAAIISELSPERPPSSPYLFQSARTGGPRDNFRKFWVRACAEAKMPMTPHALRYAAASKWFNEGKSVADVQRLLGHVSPDMATRLYIRLRPEIMPPVVSTVE